MLGDTEMQQLQPSRLSDISTRTAVATDPIETKSEQLLQAILEELRTRPDPKSTSVLAKTSTKDHCPGMPNAPQATSSNDSLPRMDLSRGISTLSAGSSGSQSGSSEQRFYQQLFTALVAFSAFGGSITFQCIFQTMPPTSQNKHITPARARTLIAISWLIFTMDLSLSSIVLAALYVSKTMLAKEDEQAESWHRRLHRYVNLVMALLLPLGSVAALVFAALAVSVLSIAVGETALISVSVLGGVILVWWFSFCIRQYCRQRCARSSPA